MLDCSRGYPIDNIAQPVWFARRIDKGTLLEYIHYKISHINTTIKQTYILYIVFKQIHKCFYQREGNLANQEIEEVNSP
jgi:hypothetical protein